MLSPLPLRCAALAAILALAGACADSTGPAKEEPVDLNAVLAELQPSALTPLASQLSSLPAAALAAPIPASCSYDGASKSFVCPTVSVTGVTVSRSFTLLDAGGTPQTAFDRTTTAAVRMKSTFAGTVTSGGTTVVIDQQQELTLSGLLTGVHTLNGTSQGQLTGSIGTGSTAIPIATTISTTITNLVLPRSGGGQWPQSGTIAATIANRGPGLPLATTVSITFNGTSTARVTVTTGGFTSTTTIDLANPGPVRG